MDIREMTFQNVLDTVLKPAGVKVGGFPEELFLDLSESDKESLTCGICFLIVNDCRQCDNKHLFCHTCVFAWSMTFGENSQKCPMCRCPQTEYLTNKEVNRILDDKRVQCYEDTCRFRSPLKIFLMHSHGKAKFSNVHVDFSRLHPPRSQVLMLPGLLLQARNPGSRVERAVGIRSQLQQGRVMIHQMMTLLHLEMQLRQQALNSYQEAQDPMRRIQRLDEVLALNEQLNEVGGILSGLLTTPLSRLSNNDESDLNGTLSDMGASLRRGLINRPSVIQGLNDPALLQRAGESMRDGLRRLRTPDNEADNTPRRTPETDTAERRFENTPFITERSNRFSRQTESPSESPIPPSTPREHVLISRAREPSRQILRSQEPTTPRMPQPTQSGESSLGVHVALPPIASPQSETPTIEETSDEPRIIPEGSGILQRVMRDVRQQNTPRRSSNTLTASLTENTRQQEPNARETQQSSLSRHRPLSRISSSLAESLPHDATNPGQDRPVATRRQPSASSSSSTRRLAQRSSQPARTLSQSRTTSRPSVTPQPPITSQRGSRTSSISQRASRTNETGQQSRTPLIRARRRSEIQEQIRFGRRGSKDNQ